MRHTPRLKDKAHRVCEVQAPKLEAQKNLPTEEACNEEQKTPGMQESNAKLLSPSSDRRTEDH